MSRELIAFIFPGQGAQYVGMAKELYDASPAARRVIEEGCDLLGRDMRPILFEGPSEELTATHNSQVAIYLHSMAMLAALREEASDIEPSVCAGLSLGEFSALTCAGRISFADCLPLVAARGHYMSEACEEQKGAMAAVVGLDDEVVERSVERLGMPDDLWVANYNCPKQVVISGTESGVKAGIESLKVAGARRLLPLQVHGAFHSGLMESARRRLADRVAEVSLSHESRVRLVMNVPGDFVDEVEAIRRNMVEQVTHSVRWKQGVEAMIRVGVTRFIEIGPGRTLAGMNGRISKEIRTLSLDKPEDIKQGIEFLRGESAHV